MNEWEYMLKHAVRYNYDMWYDLWPRPYEYVPQKNDKKFMTQHMFKLSMSTKPPNGQDN